MQGQIRFGTSAAANIEIYYQELKLRKKWVYAKGMTTCEIVATFKEMYGAGVSATLISKVTDAVIE